MAWTLSKAIPFLLVFVLINLEHSVSRTITTSPTATSQPTTYPANFTSEQNETTLNISTKPNETESNGLSVGDILKIVLICCIGCGILVFVIVVCCILRKSRITCSDMGECPESPELPDIEFPSNSEGCI